MGIIGDIFTFLLTPVILLFTAFINIPLALIFSFIEQYSFWVYALPVAIIAIAVFSSFMGVGITICSAFTSNVETERRWKYSMDPPPKGCRYTTRFYSNTLGELYYYPVRYIQTTPASTLAIVYLVIFWFIINAFVWVFFGDLDAIMDGHVYEHAPAEEINFSNTYLVFLIPLIHWIYTLPWAIFVPGVRRTDGEFDVDFKYAIVFITLINPVYMLVMAAAIAFG